MYHEQTYAQIKRRRVKLLATAIIVVAIAALLVVASLIAQASTREQAALSVRESVLNAAKQCCAVEGSYPSSISLLEEDYGLVINRDDYVVYYEWFADNVLPSVVVTAR